MSNREEHDTNNVPLLFNRATDEIERIPRLPNATNLRNYVNNNEDNKEFNVGFIDQCKSPRNVRVLLLNLHGFKPCDQKKAIMMQQAMKRLNVDVVLLQETNTKWITSNISKLERNIKSINVE